ncbi:HalOD1 output domain-containing protein [Haloferacaceae archaeon DSL9]
MTDDTTSPEPNDATRSECLSYELDANERPSRAVVTAVATLTDTSILDLNPLYHTIDPEHLDGVITGRKNDGAITESSVSFHFNGCQVTVNQHAVRVQIADD